MWNFDMSAAPKGRMETRQVKVGKTIVDREFHIPEKILVAGPDDGHVTASYWVAKAERWNCFSKGQEPIAWMPWPEYPAT